MDLEDKVPYSSVFYTGHVEMVVVLSVEHVKKP